MEPLIPVGAELLLERAKADSLERFDIIVYEEGEKLMCHYVWKVNMVFSQGDITTKSLKYKKEDVPFSFDKVKGRVVNYEIGFLLKCKILLGWS